MSDVLSTRELTGQPTSDTGAAAERQGTRVPELTAILDRRGPSTAALTGMKRAAFLFTRIGRREGIYVGSGGADFAIIYAELNPTQVSINLQTREQLEKCGGGEVLHSFVASAERAERLGAHLDEVRMTFNLTTGNCLPVRIGDDAEVKVPGGLDTFYALNELLLEDPRVLPDGRSNDLIIVMTSVQYPQMTIQGKLDPQQGIGGINLDAQDPLAIRGYTFGISVNSITPRITSHGALQIAFTEGEFGQQAGGTGSGQATGTTATSTTPYGERVTTPAPSVAELRAAAGLPNP